ncbi:MAG: PEGA domain-containing protein [Acidobacteria bacterium]|nr:PEGA domain-containing protein [Acidobacteriota bacterium]
MRATVIRALLIFAFACACAAAPRARQKDCGRPECAPTPTPRPTPRPPRTPTGPRTTAPAPCDEPAHVLVKCGLPGCSVTVDGKPHGLTNDSGELLVEGVPPGTRTVAISKPGYEGDSRSYKLGCGASETASLSLKIRPVKLRVRTSPPEAEVFVGDPPTPVGRSDAQGLFEYVANTPRLLVTARKAGHLDDNRRVNVNPGAAQQEVVLNLKAIPAQLSLTANVPGASARVDGGQPRPLTAEPLALAPGAHRVQVDALGYALAALELTVAPGETPKRSVVLERLPVAELTARAEAAFRTNAYEDVLKLCGYVYEAEPAAPAAHRLEGMVHLARQDYARAEQHLVAALAGGETIELHVRRHSRESFDLLKGHDACEGFLYLSKDVVEYRGRQVVGENFKVPHAQVQVVGVQLKKNVAAYLGTKISDARGKRQDYNFYSFDKELTAAGRPYLEMIQRLLRPTSHLDIISPRIPHQSPATPAAVELPPAPVERTPALAAIPPAPVGERFPPVETTPAGVELTPAPVEFIQTSVEMAPTTVGFIQTRAA